MHSISIFYYHFIRVLAIISVHIILLIIYVARSDFYSIVVNSICILIPLTGTSRAMAARL